MIRTEDEYRVGLRRIEESKQAIARTQEELRQQGLDAATIDMLVASMRALQRDVQDEVTAYEKARAFEFEPVSFAGLGRLLVELRIARHMSVSDLAEAVGVDKGNVSRDEKTLYRGITRERIERLLVALNVDLLVTPVPNEAAPTTTRQTQPVVTAQARTVTASAEEAGTALLHAGAGWIMPQGLLLEQPMVWPIGNTEKTQWSMAGYTFGTSMPGAQRQGGTAQSTVVNTVSNRLHGEAA